MAQKRITKSYDQEFKSQAVKLAQEIGGHKAATELGIPSGTLYTWIKAFKEGRLAAKEAAHTPYAPTLGKLTKLLSGDFTFFNESIFR